MSNEKIYDFLERYSFLDNGLPVEPGNYEEASVAVAEYRSMQAQQMICRIHTGDIDTIIEGTNSRNDLVVINAIISGAKMGISDARFLDGVSKALESDAKVMGYPLRSVAEAATLYLFGREYNGEDAVIQALLANKFDVIGGDE